MQGQCYNLQGPQLQNTKIQISQRTAPITPKNITNTIHTPRLTQLNIKQLQVIKWNKHSLTHCWGGWSSGSLQPRRVVAAALLVERSGGGENGETRGSDWVRETWSRRAEKVRESGRGIDGRLVEPSSRRRQTGRRRVGGRPEAPRQPVARQGGRDSWGRVRGWGRRQAAGWEVWECEI